MNAASAPPPDTGILPAPAKKWDRRRQAAMAAVVLVTAAFGPALFSLMMYASDKELHSHIILVPVVSVYLLMIKRGEYPGELRASSSWGGAFVAIGLLLLGIIYYLGAAGVDLSANDRHVLPALAYVSFLCATGFFFLGRGWMKVAAFPAAFLLFLAPMPDEVAHVLETASQKASAEAAAVFMKLAGLPYVRDAENTRIFYLPGVNPIEVARECSGIRSSWVLLITSLIAAHMFLAGAWRRIIFVALVIPLGVIRNGFRILVISWLCVEIDPEMIHSVIHRRGGPVFSRSP